MSPYATALAAIVDTIAPYDAGTPIEQELRAGTIIRLSANESPLGPSPTVVEALRCGIGSIGGRHWGDSWEGRVPTRRHVRVPSLPQARHSTSRGAS